MFVVAYHSVSPLDDGSDEPSGVYESDVGGLIPCETLQEVGNAIQKRGPQDWAVFELVQEKFVRRAIVFKPDGVTVQGLSESLRSKI